jgi:ankyrin repeat protein
MNGHLEIVKHLLENTEDSSVIEAVDIDGSSALALAVANGHKDLARYRLDESPFRPNTFRINFNPQILDKFHLKK